MNDVVFSTKTQLFNEACQESTKWTWLGQTENLFLTFFLLAFITTSRDLCGLPCTKLQMHKYKSVTKQITCLGDDINNQIL